MSAEKRKQLRKHKAIATGLFFLMALIYALMVYFQYHNRASWMGYVEAFSEAGMVGALADWFAVTALFKHPLGIPIPHTNLIERKKNDLGRNLGTFVNENFVSPENIRPYIERLNVVTLLTNWLNKPKNRILLEAEISNLLKKVITDLEDEQVEDFLTEKGMDLLQGLNYTDIASSGINYLLKKDEHINLLENFLPQIKAYISENESLILERISDSRPLIAFLAGKKISKEITSGLISFIEEIERNPNHFVRIKLTENLQKLSWELKNTDKWKVKFDKLKSELITKETMSPYAKDAWQAMKSTVLTQLESSDSKMREYVSKNIDKLSNSLQSDEELKNRLNNWVHHFIYRMVLKNRQEIETLISNTVESWEGKELSEKLELEVGKDLQFIRVNGTLVGGLVGLIIHTVTHLVV